MNRILFGFPACGKSTAARLAARMLGKTFVDLDELIEALYYNPKLGRFKEMSCRQIYQEHGKKFFRALEREAVRKIRPFNQAIIATGAGAVVDPYNYSELKRNGVLIYLAADEETIKARLLRQKSMPAYLSGADPEASFDAMYRERQPIYEAIADAVIETAGLSSEEVAKKIAVVEVNDKS